MLKYSGAFSVTWLDRMFSINYMSFSLEKDYLKWFIKVYSNLDQSNKLFKTLKKYLLVKSYKYRKLNIFKTKWIVR